MSVYAFSRGIVLTKGPLNSHLLLEKNYQCVCMPLVELDVCVHAFSRGRCVSL